MVDRKMSVMATDSSLDGTERLLAQGADGSVILVSAIVAYTIDELVAAAELVPTAGDAVLMERAGTEGTFDIDDLASYAVASAWTVAAEEDPALSGDLLLINRSGVIYDMDVDTLKTYALVGIQATVLNTSALGSATLGATDLFPVCQVGSPTVPKTVALSALETKLWTDFRAYAVALPEVSTSVDGDKFWVDQGGTAKFVEAETLAVYMSAEIISIGDVQTAALDDLDTYIAALAQNSAPANSDKILTIQGGVSKYLDLEDLATYAMDNAIELPWRLVATSKYTTVPNGVVPDSTSVLLMGDTSDFTIGMPVKFVQGGLTYYAIVTLVSGNASITIAGAPFNDSADVTQLYAGAPSSVVQKTYVVDTAFGDDAQDIFSEITYQRERWQLAPAYLVAFSATQGVIDSGASQPKLNVKIGTNLVSTNDLNKGIQLSAAGTWVPNPAVEIDLNNYAVTRGDAIDLRCTVAGTNGDADILSVTLLFVLA